MELPLSIETQLSELTSSARGKARDCRRRPSIARWSCRVVGVILGLVALGCARGPEYAPVSGTVSYRDKPVVAGGITFEPQEGRSAFGSIKDGKIVDVSTHREGDGVRVGTVRVGIQSTTNLGSPTGPHTPLIPPHYFDPNTSQLTVEVKASGPNQFEFKLVDPAR